jgi:hypothetical protein
MKSCAVSGCLNEYMAKGYCNRHYQSAYRYGDPLKAREFGKRGNGSATGSHGYRAIGINGITRLEHRVIAERALGHALPPKSVVHHVDGNRLNNSPSNLVICPDESYHNLLHRRQKALDACGNAEYKQCRYCKEYDHENNLTRYGGYHRKCRQINRKD